MKKVVLAIVVAFLAVNVSFAGDNPKLLKEIKRKITLDLSQLNLERSKEHFVLVQFRIVEGEIDVIDVKSSGQELTDLMLCELEEMFIKTKTDSKTIYQYKFTFEKE